MQRILAFFSQRATTLFFPVALILYDFAAYLSTDLIQPGIINVVRDFNADVSLAPAAVSLYLAGGMALQWLLGPLSDRIGRRPVLIAGALIFTLACAATLFTTSMAQFLVARFVQGTSICFIATVGYVTVQEAFGQTKAIKLMAIITSIVLVAPVIGPLSGAALMHFVHWKILFAIIAVMGLIALIGLMLAMPETVQRGAVPFSARGVVRDFRDVFRNRVFLFGAATLSLSLYPDDELGGGLTGYSDRCWRHDHIGICLGTGPGVRRSYRRQYGGGSFRERSDPTTLHLAGRTYTAERAGSADCRQFTVAARLAVVGAGDQPVCVWYWDDLPDAVPLYTVFQQLTEGYGFRIVEYGNPDGDGGFCRNWALAMV